MLTCLAFLVLAAPLPRDVPDHILLLRDKLASQPDADTFREKELALLQSKPVLRSVLARTDVRQYLPPDQKDRLAWLEKRVRFDARRPGEIRVWFRTRSPREQLTVLNALFLEYSRARFEKANPALVKNWDAKKDVTRRQLQKLEQMVARVELEVQKAILKPNPNAQRLLEQFQKRMEADKLSTKSELEKLTAERERKLAEFRQRYRLQRVQK